MSLESLLAPEGWAYASSGTGRFHCLFGRDSLITALQVLPVRPRVARATLGALAARQGVRFDPLTLEEPGKIGHEFRALPPPSASAAASIVSRQPCWARPNVPGEWRTSPPPASSVRASQSAAARAAAPHSPTAPLSTRNQQVASAVP